MPYDLIIKNAKICDGTGAPIRDGAVAVEDGSIVAAGSVTGSAQREINADGLVVAPGFIDIHTHYDAQIAWDPMLTSSCWHGVTSVLMGNCGVGVAPCRPEAREMMAWDLVNVEAMPYDVLLNGVPWEWTTFPEYIHAVMRPGVGLNVGFMVPLSALRFYVMGEAASERAATAEETQRMVAIFREAMRGGAYGFSLSMFELHNGYQGRPLASRLASVEELAALARVMREFDRGVIEISAPRSVRNRGLISEEGLDLVVRLAQESGQAVTWLSLLDVPGIPPGAQEEILARLEPYQKQGLKIRPQTTTRPLQSYVTIREPFSFGSYTCWKKALNRTLEEQMALYASTQFRDDWRAEDRIKGNPMLWDTVEVIDVVNERNKRFFGKSIAEISAELNKDPFDTFLDLALDEELATGFLRTGANGNRERVQQLITLPNVLLGLSDAGAHVNQICQAGLPTHLLHEWSRKLGVFSLEEAVRRITSEPADFMGLQSKGRIKVGMDADLVMFDPDKVGPLPIERVYDLPGGKPRLIERSTGVAMTIVNGEVLLDHGEHQGAFPGRLISAA